MSSNVDSISQPANNNCVVEVGSNVFNEMVNKISALNSGMPCADNRGDVLGVQVAVAHRINN